MTNRLTQRLAAMASACALLMAPPALARGVDEAENPAQPRITTEPIMTGAAESAAEGTPQRTGRPALWKVADDDTTVYLFGTVHVLPDNIDWMSGTLKNAFDGADTVVTEIDEPEPTDPRLQMLVLSKATLPPGENLRAKLTDEQREKYEAVLTELGLPVAAFDGFKPWYAGITLATLPLIKEGYKPDQGVESVLNSRSDQSAKQPQREFLETIDYQLSIFDSLPEETQRKYLIQLVDSFDEIKPTLDRMVDEWLEGDADALAELINADMDDPELMERLLYERNRNWANWISARLDKPGTVFIAVGAGHLAGDGSVQDELAKKYGIQSVRVQ